MTTVRHPADDGLLVTGGNPGHAGAQGGVALFLLVTEEHVAVVDPTVTLEHAHRAQPALALAAVPHHLDASGLQRLEHGGVLVDHDLSAE